MTQLTRLLGGRLRASLVAVAVAVAVSGACSKDPEAVKREHLRLGDEYVAQKKYSEAVIEFSNAVQADPKSGESQFKLAEAAAKAGQTEKAIAAYIRAGDLAPENTEIQLKAGQVFLLARRYADARARARTILEREPQNAMALIMLGNALAGLRSFDEAVAANQRAIALDPKRAGMYVNLGAIQFGQGHIAEAEAAYKAAVAAEPNSAMALLGLADFYMLAGRIPEAEKVYLDALKLDPNHSGANRAVAVFYIESGRLPQAEPYLKKMVEIDNTAESLFNLADYYVAAQRRGEALQILQLLRTKDESFTTATVKMALMAQIDGYSSQALQLLDQVFAKQPNSAAGLALKTHILLKSRNRTEALAAAQAAVAADPKSEAAQFALGAAARARGQNDLAKRSFNEVLKSNPSSTEAMMELANLNLIGRQLDSAQQFAEQAVRSNPRLPEARLTLARVLASRPEGRSRADAELVKLEKDYPKSVDVQVEIGRLSLARGDVNAATRAFTRAVQLNPDALEPLIELVQLDLKAGRLPAARKRIDEALLKSPDSPVLLMVAGKAYASIDGEVAEKHLLKAAELDPSNIDAYETLATLYLGHQRVDQARDQFVKLTKQQPNSPAPHIIVGILSELQGQPAEAEKWYERALQLNSRSATAANNLAWLLAQKGQDLDRALQLAQSAHSEMPGQVSISDTLGWVYLKKGQPENAVRLFAECVELAPQNAQYHYHLGLAYAQSGQDAKARIALQRSLVLSPNSPDAPKVKEALTKLFY